MIHAGNQFTHWTATCRRLGVGGCDVPISSAVIEQRVASAHHDFLDFSDKNRVIARILGAMQPALEVGQGAVEHRGTVRRAIKVRSRLLFGMAMVLGGAGIVFGDDLLVVGQHVYPKTLPGMQVSVGAGAMVNANQHQRRIERHRAESVGGHTVNFTFVVHCNHGHSSGKTS